MGWIDSHCHLDFPEFNDLETLLPQLKAKGCERILLPGTQSLYFDRQQRVQNLDRDFVWCAYGLHPYFLSQHQDSHLQDLENTLQSQPCKAVGEIGLDFMLPADTHEKQTTLFAQQVDLAKQHKLPLVLHCRKAHDQLSSHLKKQQFDHGGFVHGFSGSLQQAKRYLDLGFVLGLGGALTYDRAKALKNLVKSLPDDAYVLETDSPDMRPAFARDQPNSPLNVPRIAEQIAQLRGVSLEVVYTQSNTNFYGVLPA